MKTVGIALFIELLVSGSWADSGPNLILKDDKDTIQDTNLLTTSHNIEKDRSTGNRNSIVVNLNTENLNLEVAKKSHFVMFFVEG